MAYILQRIFDMQFVYANLYFIQIALKFVPIDHTGSMPGEGVVDGLAPKIFNLLAELMLVSFATAYMRRSPWMS